MINPNWNKNRNSPQRDYEWSNNFVQSYYNSEGFKERLNKHGWKHYPKYSAPQLVNEAQYGYYFQPKDYRKNSSLYPNQNIINYGWYNDKKSDGFVNRESLFAHELAHYIDYLLSTNKEIRNYTESYPIFRRNKMLQVLLNDKYHKDEWDVAKNHPNSLSDERHDFKPEESYADLISLRDQLYRAGIYDSRKANNPFTKKHLESFKELNPNFRLFNYFSDNDIIIMMNEVADNGYQESDIQYAKFGRKLIKRKPYIK